MCVHTFFRRMAMNSMSVLLYESEVFFLQGKKPFMSQIKMVTLSLQIILVRSAEENSSKDITLCKPST